MDYPKSMTTGWMQSASNTRVHYEHPNPESFAIEDIALGLSRQVRWSGQGTFPYSVAQHSVLVALQVTRKNRIHGLMHDAHEAYTGDIPGPLKQILGQPILDIEDRLQRAIYEGLGIEWPDDDAIAEVAHADKSLLEAENDVLFTEKLWTFDFVKPAEVEIEMWDQSFAEAMFLAHFGTTYKRYKDRHAKS